MKNISFWINGGLGPYKRDVFLCNDILGGYVKFLDNNAI